MSDIRVEETEGTRIAHIKLKHFYNFCFLSSFALYKKLEKRKKSEPNGEQ